MPTLRFDYGDFIQLVNHKLQVDELIEKLPLFGIGVEQVESNQLTVEISPNRPDLFSVEGIARAMRCFFGFESGLKHYEVKEVGISLRVDPSVKSVRPLIRCALIKGINLKSVESLMEFQEKLHESIGQQRKRMAIGLHDFSKIKPPFTYKAVTPEAVEFIPLGAIKPMTLKEILEQHEKGIEFRHLVTSFDKYPLIIDSTNAILSFPPIINSRLTTLTQKTRDCFIDVTGTNLKAVDKALNALSTALAERGGKVYQVSILDGKEIFLSPDLSSKELKLDPAYSNQILGIKLSKKSQSEALARMGYDAIPINEKIKVKVPAWRWDILHQIDLVEDIAIGWGFDKFKPAKPISLTYGKELEQKRQVQRIRELMLGLGFSEVVTLALIDKSNQFEKLGLKAEQQPVAELENPISKDYSLLRVNLISSLLNSLKANKRYPLPQQLFEVGEVIDWRKGKPLNCLKVAGVKINSKTNFTQCKSVIQALLQQLGIKVKLKEKTHPAFILGRCASIVSNRREIGYFGELHPQVITNFELENPIIGFEIKVA
jgi:phenylalanyl-tRNA synthetase beta chain